MIICAPLHNSLPASNSLSTHQNSKNHETQKIPQKINKSQNPKISIKKKKKKIKNQKIQKFKNFKNSKIQKFKKFTTHLNQLLQRYDFFYELNLRRNINFMFINFNQFQLKGGWCCSPVYIEHIFHFFTYCNT